MDKLTALVHLANGLMAGHHTAFESQEDSFYENPKDGIPAMAERLYEAIRIRCLEGVPEPEPVTQTASTPAVVIPAEPLPPFLPDDLPDETPSEDGPDAPDADLPPDLDPDDVFPEAAEPPPGHDCDEQGCLPDPKTGVCTACGHDFSQDADWLAARDAALAGA